MVSALLPWPSRTERKARVAEARQQAAKSEEKAVEARSLVAELHRLRRRNHVSEALDQMICRKAREQR